jgi:hypothetical protein
MMVLAGIGMTRKPRTQVHRRSIKIRQVFAELRRVLGLEIPAGELLRLAVALVDATTLIESRDDHRSVGPKPACDQLPLDKAWEDGGWRIMDSESRWIMEVCRDDDPSYATAQPRIRKAELAA